MLKIVEVKHNKEEQCYIASIPFIHVDAFGDTRKEALDELGIAFKLWVSAMDDILRNHSKNDVKMQVINLYSIKKILGNDSLASKFKTVKAYRKAVLVEVDKIKETI